MKKNKFIFVLLLLVSISAVAFGSTFLYLKINNESSDEKDFVIMTSCNPVYIATLNIAGDIDGVSVENLSQPTTGCLHDYTLTTQDMKNLSYADVLVINGGGMEGYLEDVMEAYPDLPIIDASQNMTFLDSDEDDHENESDADHNHEAELEDHSGHDHGDNSHVWLSIYLYEEEIHEIAAGLSQLDHAHADQYTQSADALKADIETKLGPEIAELSEKLSGQNTVLLHEAYEYIAEDLGLEVAATLDLDEERQVSAGEVANVISAIEDNDVRLVLAEEDYGSDMGNLIMEQTQAKVVYLNTLIHGSFEKDDYIDIMLDNYQQIDEALSGLGDL